MFGPICNFLCLHGKLPKTAKMNQDHKSDEFNCSILKSDHQKIFKQAEAGLQDTFLPKYIQLNVGLGLMRLRSYPTVLRIHDSRKKDQDHEKFYSELLFFFFRVLTITFVSAFERVLNMTLYLHFNSSLF